MKKLKKIIGQDNITKKDKELGPNFVIEKFLQEEALIAKQANTDPNDMRRLNWDKLPTTVQNSLFGAAIRERVLRAKLKKLSTKLITLQKEIRKILK